jgi:hypothetical protein
MGELGPPFLELPVRLLELPVPIGERPARITELGSPET